MRGMDCLGCTHVHNSYTNNLPFCSNLLHILIFNFSIRLEHNLLFGVHKLTEIVLFIS